MKYIMFEDFSGSPVPVIFPKRINFNEIREQIPYSKVLSAGYVQVRQGKFYCHGESKSLGVEAGPGDASVIEDKFSNPDE